MLRWLMQRRALPLVILLSPALSCQGGGDGCIVLMPVGIAAGTLAGLGIGAAISNTPVDAEPIWR